jgi:hypothetical protein
LRMSCVHGCHSFAEAGGHAVRARRTANCGIRRTDRVRIGCDAGKATARCGSTVGRARWSRAMRVPVCHPVSRDREGTIA